MALQQHIFRPGVSLDHLLANRRWIRREVPFPHLVATNVFTQPFYNLLAQEFYREFEREAPEGLQDPALRMNGYDAYGLHFPPGIEGPLSIFLSRPWHDLLGSLFRVNATGFINAGLHHHAIGSNSGLVHNDLSIGWFVDYEALGGIRVPRHDLCRYTDGTPLVPDVSRIEMVRSVTMMFYLANPVWEPGHGGETGLYRCSNDDVHSPAATVPPINNSILMFECTPVSYHSFLRNNQSTRNSVIMWLHQPKSEAVAKWGDDKIVRFPRAPS